MQGSPGAYAPVVDHGKCEGKGDCVEVCPYDVFDVTQIADEDYRALGWRARLRVKVHGMQTAYTRGPMSSLQPMRRRLSRKRDPARQDRFTDR
jgi:NAD-dependent dihydropyrimidine dehydrogenase PreA subunit